MTWRRVMVLSTMLVLAFAGDLLSACSSGEEAAEDTGTAVETATTGAAELSFDRPTATSDPFGDPSGPYYHQVLKASSPDGLQFTKAPGVVFDKASVPDTVVLSDGRIAIYAVDGSGRSVSGLMVAISADGGETWEQGSVQLETAAGNRFGAADPDAVVLPDGSIRMYYVIFPPKPEPGEPLPATVVVRINSALSTDGVDFKEEEGSRFESLDLITDPDVVEIGGKYFMYISRGTRNVALSSADGFEFREERTIREDGAVSNTVPVGDGLYRQYFCRMGISSAVSSNGLDWQDEPGVRIGEEAGQVVCDPAPVFAGGRWIMFFKAGPMPQPGQEPQGGMPPPPLPPGGQPPPPG